MEPSNPTALPGPTAIVLAAGEGTRMRSSRPKVLHEIAGRSMLAHCLAAIAAANIEKVALVVGPDREDVARQVQGARLFVQRERRGTAHAVLAAEGAFVETDDDIIVAFADTPLVRAETYAHLLSRLRETRAAVVVAGFQALEPTGYGRLLMEGDVLSAIREERDASPAERAVKLCNGGLMALDGRHALDLLRSVRPQNAQNEYYLTDVVALARARGLPTSVLEIDEEEILGINDRAQLARAEAAMQTRLRAAAMRAGVTLVDPASVTLAFDTRFGPDVVIEPNVIFAPGVTVGEGARIRGFSHLDGVSVGARAVVGPFARLRPGSVLEEDVHVGNFVEVKASTLHQGVKANHLSYIGDATVGRKTNIGAGTITCNYDGFRKFRTTIGEGAFIGVNTALVAPVTVGEGAFVATGSVVTGDVAADSLLIARARPVEKPGWAKAFRDAHAPARTTCDDKNV